MLNDSYIHNNILGAEIKFWETIQRDPENKILRNTHFKAQPS